VPVLRVLKQFQIFKIKNLQIMCVFCYVQVEEVAVMGPAVAMEEVEGMVGLEVRAVATMHTVAHTEPERVDTQEAAMGHMVGVATVVMAGEGMEEEEEEGMEEEDMEGAVAMVDMVDLDMGVVWEVHMEGMASMEEEQGGLADHSQGAMKVTVLGR
jgi:hypothetical protein